MEQSMTSQSTPSLNLLGVNVSRVDYDSAVTQIINAAKLRQSFGVTAMAVHGLMEAHRDANFAAQVNRLDMVAPDGQPVRWALNLLGARELKDRVYGPTLTLKVCERATRENHTRKLGSVYSDLKQIIIAHFNELRLYYKMFFN